MVPIAANTGTIRTSAHTEETMDIDPLSTMATLTSPTSITGGRGVNRAHISLPTIRTNAESHLAKAGVAVLAQTGGSAAAAATNATATRATALMAGARHLGALRVKTGAPSAGMVMVAMSSTNGPAPARGADLPTCRKTSLSVGRLFPM